MFPFMFQERRVEEAAGQVEMALALAQPPGKSALDLCCGPGRCSIALAQRGFTVTGVDRTRYLLDQARTRAAAAQVEVEWIQQDMRDFLRPEAFDLVLSMFTSFGYFDDKEEDVQVLANILACLKPGGALVIDVMSKERLARIFQPTITEQLDDGTLLVQRHAIFDDWTRIRNEWILIREGQARHYHFYHTVYSGQELRQLMEGVGFVQVRLYGSLAGGEYDLDARRLVAVGRKAER
jgi:SAM-dependent methyltransferase